MLMVLCLAFTGCARDEKTSKDDKKDALAILNADDEMIYSLKEKTQAKVLSFSLENDKADFGISDLDLSTGKGKFIFNINRDIKLKGFTIKKSNFKVELGSVGYSSVMNSVVAIIVALCLNIEKEIITDALKNFKGVERRFELIFDEDFKILDDDKDKKYIFLAEKIL